MSALNHDHDDLAERELTILYATETGNAQDVAERIAVQCRRLHFSVHVHSIDEYRIVGGHYFSAVFVSRSTPIQDSIFSTHLILFIVSTAGTGREPRSMTPFWTALLRSDLPHDLFDHLDFAVFGLGDSAYEKFCWPAKMLERRLLSLGAKSIVERGEGDDQDHLG